MGGCQEQKDIAVLQDQLAGGLIGLARAADGSAEIPFSVDLCMLEGLAVLFSAEPDGGYLREQIQRTTEAKRELAPDCFICSSPCGRINDYDMEKLWNAEEESRSLKIMLLNGIQCMAAYALRAAELGFIDSGVNSFFYKALFAIGMDGWGMGELLPILKEAGTVSFKCRNLWKKRLLNVAD